MVSLPCERKIRAIPGLPSARRSQQYQELSLRRQQCGFRTKLRARERAIIIG